MTTALGTGAARCPACLRAMTGLLVSVSIEEFHKVGKGMSA